MIILYNKYTTLILYRQYKKPSENKTKFVLDLPRAVMYNIKVSVEFKRTPYLFGRYFPTRARSSFFV